MHATSTSVAPALSALLEKFIDYAGIYPPASLSLQQSVENYGSYETSGHSWMLRWLVVGAQELSKIPGSLDGHLSLLSENDDTRAAALETKAIVNATRPVYCEVSTDNLELLKGVKERGCFGKIRTGGLKPEAIPTPAQVASFILACADLRLPFKATAGLHHPIRATYRLSYETDAPRGVMHGFLNVVMAAAFAWHGEKDILPILSETDAKAFSFDARAHWREKSLDVEQIREARKEFMHSIGSCSFEEPVQELKELGLL